MRSSPKEDGLSLLNEREGQGLNRVAEPPKMQYII